MSEDIKEYTVEEAVEKVKEIGLRYERQLELAEATAKIDRQRKVLREAQKPDTGG